MVEVATLREAVAAHVTRAGEKLREQGLVAGRLTAFARTDPHRSGRQHHGAHATRLTPMTGDTRELVAAAGRCLEAAWRGGFAYVKAGVLLDNLDPPGAAPPCLSDQSRPGSTALIAAVDEINARPERGAMFSAGIRLERAWRSGQRIARRGARRESASCRWC